MSVVPSACSRRCWFLLLAPLLGAQTQAPSRVVSAGYSAPRPVRVAPGQILTLFVRSDRVQFEQAVASGLPLPIALGGYSVALRQTFSSSAITVPLLSVYPVNNCYGIVPLVCTNFAAITVQIPWELVPNSRGLRRPENFAVLTVSFGGTAGEAVPLDAATDSIHVLNSCDSTIAPGTERPSDLTGPCKAVITHSDGRLVTPLNPAVVGEVVVMYAFGLGDSGGVAITGDASQDSVPIAGVAIEFKYGANLAPSQPSAQAAAPKSADLTAGEVGLYQIAFVVPSLPLGTPSCGATTIAANATVSAGRLASFDGAAICVRQNQ